MRIKFVTALLLWLGLAVPGWAQFTPTQEYCEMLQRSLDLAQRTLDNLEHPAVRQLQISKIKSWEAQMARCGRSGQTPAFQEPSRSSSGGGTKEPTIVVTFPCPFGDGGVINVHRNTSARDAPYIGVDAVIRLNNNCGEGGNYYVAGPNGNLIHDDFGIIFFHNDPFYYKENIPYISFDNLNNTGRVIVKQYTVFFCRPTDVYSGLSAFCFPRNSVIRSKLTVKWLH